MEDAQADERAAEVIAGEAEEMSLDEIIAAEEKAAATNETIAEWIK